MDSDFVKEQREKAIPKGSKLPHGPDWKGNVREEREVPAPVSTLTKFRIQTSTRGKRRQKPTQKQVDALKYYMQGYSKRQALLKAGYAVSVANAPTEYFRTPMMLALYDKMQGHFEREGITLPYVAKKVKQWFEAESVTVDKYGGEHRQPDYKIQQGAFDRWKSFVEPKQGEGQLKKKEMTLTEYITGDENET